MASNGEPETTTDTVPEPAPLSQVRITFAGVGLADHTVALDHVDPAQVYAAAFVLDMLARELRSGSLIKQALAPDGLGQGLDLAALLGGRRG